MSEDAFHKRCASPVIEVDGERRFIETAMQRIREIAAQNSHRCYFMKHHYSVTDRDRNMDYIVCAELVRRGEARWLRAWPNAYPPGIKLLSVTAP